MNDLGKNIQWGCHIENYLKDIGEKCYGYSILHKKSEDRFNFYSVFIDIPSIVLSTIAGTLSIGSNSMFIPGSTEEQYFSYGVGVLSLTVGVVQTINSYFSWNKRTENHRLSSLNYGKLYRFISIELSLPRDERIACYDLMKVVRESYERLAEMSPLIPYAVIDDFKKCYINSNKYTNISKPSECNGLESIEIFSTEEKSATMEKSNNINQNDSDDNDNDDNQYNNNSPDFNDFHNINFKVNEKQYQPTYNRDNDIRDNDNDTINTFMTNHTNHTIYTDNTIKKYVVDETPVISNTSLNQIIIENNQKLIENNLVSEISSLVEDNNANANANANANNVNESNDTNNNNSQLYKDIEYANKIITKTRAKQLHEK